MDIHIEEIDDGFVLTLYDDEAPSDTDRKVHKRTMKETLDSIVNYYEEILQWRKASLEIQE